MREQADEKFAQRLNFHEQDDFEAQLQMGNLWCTCKTDTSALALSRIAHEDSIAAEVFIPEGSDEAYAAELQREEDSSFALYLQTQEKRLCGFLPHEKHFTGLQSVRFLCVSRGSQSVFWLS